MHINLHKFLAHSTENGPGLRAVVWVQGCTLNCPGCFNPDTHDVTARQRISVTALAQKILTIPDIEGLTISGGEPFLQAAALAELCQRLHEADLGIVVFSGFPYAELIQSHKADWKHLLAVTDLLIAGPFIKEQACDLALRGSSNQTLHYLSARYRAYQTLFERTSNSVEIHIDETGQVLLTGFPTQEFLASPSDSIEK
jgi:anaerobic ribonucleoside-triphosphate reductase activating protein